VRGDYAGQIRRHLIPFFGPMPMRDIMPEQVRQWVTYMKNKGAKARTIEYCKRSILNAIFSTAMMDNVTGIHPCHGVKVPAVPQKPRSIITAAQFDRLYRALPDASAQLLVETDIESGLRWGELTELRVHDLDFATCMLTVTRAVVELPPDEHPEGGRFLVKDYPKDKEYRRFKLSRQITAKIRAHVMAMGLRDDDLLFFYQAPGESRTRQRSTVSTLPLGITEPNEKGCQYRHGTLTAYITPVNAAVSTAVVPTRTTVPGDAPAGKTSPAHRGPAIQTVTFQRTGSATRYGARPAWHAG